MVVLEYFDIFNSKFHFYTDNQPVNHSIFGGVMSLSFLILCIIVTLLFEYDELFKLNPISAKSEINYVYDVSKEKLDKGKVWIPFRIATYEHKFIDHRGILYPIIYSVKGTKTKDNEIDLEYKELNYKLCNETAMANKTDNYIIGVNLNELFCIDDEFSEIGSTWEKEEVDHIEINLFLCQDGISFNTSDPRCQNLNNLASYYSSAWLIEFYYPIIQFQPTDKKIPILVVYKSNYYRLSSFASKVERLYLKQHILSDDQNILLNNPKNSTYWGMSNLYGNSYFLSALDPLVKIPTSRIFSILIYKEKGLVFYTRSYKKLLAIISDIFPIINIIMLIFKRITVRIKSSYLRRNLMELLFEIRNQKNTSISNEIINDNNVMKNKITKMNSLPIKYSMKKRQLNLNNFGKRKSNDLINSIRDEIIYDKSFQLMNLNKINNRILNCDDLNGIQNKNIKRLVECPISNQKFDIQFNNFRVTNIKKIMSIKPNNMEHITKKNKLFPIYFYFMDIFLDFIKQPKKFCIVSKQYLMAYNFMSQLYDISTYILLYEQFNIMRKVLYFRYYDCFAKSTKINILNEEIMTSINENLRNKKNVIFSDQLLVHCYYS